MTGLKAHSEASTKISRIKNAHKTIKAELIKKRNLKSFFRSHVKQSRHIQKLKTSIKANETKNRFQWSKGLTFFAAHCRSVDCRWRLLAAWGCEIGAYYRCWRYCCSWHSPLLLLLLEKERRTEGNDIERCVNWLRAVFNESGNVQIVHVYLCFSAACIDNPCERLRACSKDSKPDIWVHIHTEDFWIDADWIPTKNTVRLNFNVPSMHAM